MCLDWWPRRQRSGFRLGRGPKVQRVLQMSRASARCSRQRFCWAPCMMRPRTSRPSDACGIRRSQTQRRQSNSADKHAQSWALNCLKQTARTSARFPPPPMCCSPAGSNASGFLQIPTSLPLHPRWWTAAARRACRSLPISRPWRSWAQPSTSARITARWESPPALSQN